MTRFLTFTLLLAWSVLPAAAADPSASVRLYLELAEASRAAYDDGPDVVVTPAGCAARITTRADGALVIAFRGSMLGDRSGRGRFSTFGGATMRRNYRDWAATNLKQTAGFLPRQYLEAADLVVERVTSHPADQPIFITGHSKGGGAAAYAAAAACLAEGVSPDRARRLRVVTFNAAVVQPSNWQRLYRRHRLANREAENRIAGVLTITAVTLRDDPVSKIRGAERPAFEQVVQLQPVPDSLSSLEQHGIEAVIAALTAVGFGSLDR